jgi:GNAT superfamily N-acetyltransferase
MSMITVRETRPDDPEFLSLQKDYVWEYQRCLIAREAGTPRGCLCFHQDESMFGAPPDVGVVGHYEARDLDAGVALLKEATGRLRQLGVKTILGPINGSVWSRFRLAHTTEEPPFFLEPTNPETYHDHFKAAGFFLDTEYQSRIIENLSSAPVVVPPLADGFRVRPFDLSKPDAELPALYELSSKAFAEHLYHRPISFEGFAAMHLPMLHRLDPDLFLIIEAPDGSLAAFLLAYPDFSQEGSGRVVAKTLGVLPDWRRKKLGSYLVARIQEICRDKGYRCLIHALMEKGGASNTISTNVLDKNERIFRTYSLYRLETDRVPQA